MILYVIANLIKFGFSLQGVSFLFSVISICITAILFFWNLIDRKRDAIPVLILDEDLTFSEPHYYNADDDGCFPINLIINNNSIASAFNIKITVKPDFSFLIEKKLIKKTSTDTIYEDNHLCKINHVFDSDNPYFLFSRGSALGYEYQESFQVKRDSIKGNQSIKISSREIIELNNLIDSCLAYSHNAGSYDEFYIPLVLKIEYNSNRNKNYFTIYDLAIRIAHRTMITVNDKIEIQKFGFQILKNEISTNTFKIK